VHQKALNALYTFVVVPMPSGEKGPHQAPRLGGLGWWGWLVPKLITFSKLWISGWKMVHH